MKIVLATNNMDKVREIKSVLSGLNVEIFTLKDLGLEIDVLEDGETFEANAAKKAVEVARRTKMVSVADDSGLEVNVLGGKPGVYSARFAGPGCTYDDNNRELLRLLKDVPENKKQARFVSVIAIAEPTGKIRTVRGVCCGKISEDARGKDGFGYDPVFIPRGRKKTFAEIKLEEKNKISHRARALAKAQKIICGMCS